MPDFLTFKGLLLNPRKRGCEEALLSVGLDADKSEDAGSLGAPDFTKLSSPITKDACIVEVETSLV